MMRVVAIAISVLAAAAPPAGAAPRPDSVERCSGQSSASFPGAFRKAANLKVGPLAMIAAGRFTDPATVREFGGNKFPLLVRAGHRVTIELSRRARRHVSLGWGRMPQGEHDVADGHRVVAFHACDRAHAWSTADGDPVTFWSGFVLADSPRCVRLRVWVDDEPRPRRTRIELGRRC